MERILDQIEGAERAYSLKKLSSSYKGEIYTLVLKDQSGNENEPVEQRFYSQGHVPIEEFENLLNMYNKLKEAYFNLKENQNDN